MLSLVVPCYNEEGNIEQLYNATIDVLQQLEVRDYEFIIVDDGSTDETLRVAKKLMEDDKSVHYISFSRNFGKEAAMLAGIEKAKGNLVSILDADMQDPPTLLIEMFEVLGKTQCDCVVARRVTRKGEPPIRSLFARMFYKISRKMSEVDIADGCRDFRLMTRPYVNAFISLQEKSRFSKGLYSWVGFKTEFVAYENVNRAGGETKWSFWKLLMYSIDGILSFSTVPLALVSMLGLVFCLVSLALIIFFVIQKLAFGNDVEGWASMMCIILMLSGVQLFTLGVIGQYIMKIFSEVKNRPVYIIKEDIFIKGQGKNIEK